MDHPSIPPRYDVQAFDEVLDDAFEDESDDDSLGEDDVLVEDEEDIVGPAQAFADSMNPVGTLDTP